MKLNSFIQNNQTLLLLGGLGVGGFIMYKQMGDGLKNLFPFGNDQTTKNTDSILSEFEKDRAVTTALNPSIKELAETLYSALRGFGTDEKKVFEVFTKVTTGVQVKALYVAYGKRPSYDSFDWFGFANKDMVQALKEDLEPAEFLKLIPKLRAAGLYI